MPQDTKPCAKCGTTFNTYGETEGYLDLFYNPIWLCKACMKNVEPIIYHWLAGPSEKDPITKFLQYLADGNWGSKDFINICGSATNLLSNMKVPMKAPVSTLREDMLREIHGQDLKKPTPAPLTIIDVNERLFKHIKHEQYDLDELIRLREEVEELKGTVADLEFQIDANHKFHDTRLNKISEKVEQLSKAPFDVINSNSAILEELEQMKEKVDLLEFKLITEQSSRETIKTIIFDLKRRFEKELEQLKEKVQRLDEIQHNLSEVIRDHHDEGWKRYMAELKEEGDPRV